MTAARDWDAYLMGFAQHAATQSKDSTQVGAALWVKRAVRQRFMDRETYMTLVAEKQWDQTHIVSIDGFRESLRTNKAAAPTN